MNVVPGGVWLRRGTGPAAGVAMVTFCTAILGLQHPWVDEADWGLRYLAAAAYIIAPVLAAACANDVARKATPTLVELSRTTGHRARLGLSMVLSVWAWSLVAAGLSAAVVVLIASVNGGVPARDPWLLAEAASIFLAAATIGLVIGQHVSGVLAPVLAAVASFTAANVLGPLGVPLFTTAVASGSLVGLERNGVNASVGITLHLTLALVFAAWSWWWSGPLPVHGVLAKMWVTGAFLVMVGVGAAVVSEPDGFVPTSERYVCVGTHPALCGPQSAEAVMRSAQRGFASAASQLDGRGLTLTPTVVVLRGPAVQERAAEGTPFALDPSRVHNGFVDHRDVAAVLAAPRACAALFSDSDFQPVLADIDVVQRWMVGVLNEAPGSSASGASPRARAPAPASVVDAYQRLSRCPLA